jgi:hypothetical protein
VESTKYFEFRKGARLFVAYISVLATKHKLKRQSGKLKIPFAGNGGGGLLFSKARRGSGSKPLLSFAVILFLSLAKGRTVNYKSN